MTPEGKVPNLSRVLLVDSVAAAAGGLAGTSSNTSHIESAAGSARAARPASRRSVGIGAGFVSWVFIKVIRGKTSAVHPLMWVVAVAFLIFFARDWLQTVIPA